MAKFVVACLMFLSIGLGTARALPSQGGYNCLRLYDEASSPMMSEMASSPDLGMLINLGTGIETPISLLHPDTKLFEETASPDGQYITYLYSDKSYQKTFLYLLEPSSVNPRLLGTIAERTSESWSKNGQFLYITTDGQLDHLSIFDGPHQQDWELTQLAPESQTDYFPLWSQNADYVAILQISQYSSMIQIWSVADKRLIKTITTNLHTQYDIQNGWSPDGQYLVYPKQDSAGTYGLYLTSLNNDEDIKLPVTWSQKDIDVALVYDGLNWISDQYLSYVYLLDQPQKPKVAHIFDTNGVDLPFNLPGLDVIILLPTADPNKLWAIGQPNQSNVAESLVQLNLNDSHITAQTLSTGIDIVTTGFGIDAKRERIAIEIAPNGDPSNPKIGIFGVNGSHYVSEKVATRGWIRRLEWMGDHLDVLSDGAGATIDQRAWYKPDGSLLYKQPDMVDGNIIYPNQVGPYPDVKATDHNHVIIFAYAKGNQSSQGFTYLLNIETGNIKQLNNVPEWETNMFVIAPDGYHSALELGGNTIYVLNSDGSVIETFPNTVPRAYNNFTWVPCG